ncbi:hypothetical protein D3C80_698480 [compost metagenome]
MPAHLRPIHERLRISRLRGWPPAAWLWWVQSGLMWNQPTGRPWHSSSGSPSKTSVVKWRAAGWLAVCMLMAAGLWFFATVTGRPRPISSPVPAPPPPQKKSTTISSSCGSKPRAYWVLKSSGFFFWNADMGGPRQGGVIW